MLYGDRISANTQMLYGDIISTNTQMFYGYSISKNVLVLFWRQDIKSFVPKEHDLCVFVENPCQ